MFSCLGDEGNAVPTEERTTTPYMTKYEKARILGTRALQIRFVERIVTIATLGVTHYRLREVIIKDTLGPDILPFIKRLPVLSLEIQKLLLKYEVLRLVLTI